MIIVHAEHEIQNFDNWKAAFDRDPIRREQSGVRHYRVVRPVDDPNFVIMDFEFETTDAAQAFQTALHRLWASPTAAPALRGRPQTRLVEPVETRTYSGQTP
jgi:quinol monooxygenase YgiN